MFELPDVDGSYAATPITLATFAAGYVALAPLNIDAAGDIFGETNGGPDLGTVFEIPKVSTGYGAVETLQQQIYYEAGKSEPVGGTLDVEPSGNILGLTQGEVFQIDKTAEGYAEPYSQDITPAYDVSDENGMLVNAAGELFISNVNNDYYGNETGLDGTIIEATACYCRAP